MTVSSRGGGQSCRRTDDSAESGTPKVQRSGTRSPRDAAMTTRPGPTSPLTMSNHWTRPGARIAAVEGAGARSVGRWFGYATYCGVPIGLLRVTRVAAPWATVDA